MISLPGIITALLLFSAPASDSGAGASAPFSPEVMELLRSCRSVKTPVLPDPDNWDLLDSPLSAAPGRMRMPRRLIVDKPRMRLHITNILGDTLSSYRVCASRNKGQKTKADDWRTPEGTFRIVGVYNSTDWTYKDTKDKCYGPFFISLITPGFWGIGIHGTNSPGSIPGRRSHGCIRMHNEDIVRVRQMVDKDTRVTVTPDPEPLPEDML